MTFLFSLSCGTFGSSQVSVDQVPSRIAHIEDKEKSGSSIEPHPDFVRPIFTIFQPDEFRPRKPARRQTFPDSETRSGILSRAASFKSPRRRHTTGSQPRPQIPPIMPLESKTIASHVRSKLRELEWIPRDFGKEILNACATDSLLEEIKRNTQGLMERENQTLEDFVLEKAPQLCIMLLRFKKFDLIGKFYRCGITDSDFPLSAWQDDHDPEQMHITNPQTTLMIDDETSEYLFCCGSPLQHQFFVPVLKWNGFNDAPIVGRLPYLKDPETISTTDFSIVRKSTIGQQHVDIMGNGLKIEKDKDNNPLVATKELLRNSMTSSQFKTLTRYEYNCLEKLRGPDFDTPHLIKAAAFYRKGDGLFFVFPWAPHGNLLKFWKEKSPEVHDQRYVKWLFGQLLGIARTVRRLHEPQFNIRHGDLKPENILCFESSNPGSNPPYVFVISDVGLAKEHERLTQFRSRTKQPGGGTMVYAAPEMEIHENRATSRRYDIWSLGCIYLESIIWLLYGIEGLKRFSEDKRGKFYKIQDNANALRPGGIVKTAELDPAVLHWISDAIKISRTAQNKGSAVSRLLEIIRDRLLVIEANPDYVDLKSADHDEAVSMSPVSPEIPNFKFDRASTDLEKRFSNERAYAAEIHSKISEIINQAETGEIEWVSLRDSTLHTPPDSPLTPDRSALKDNEFLNDLSEYVPDNEASAEVFDSFAPLALARKESNLCTRCCNLSIFPHDFVLEATMHVLMRNSSQCDLCRLLCHVLKGMTTTTNDILRFFRVGSTIRVNNQQLPAILSLSTLPRKGEIYDLNIQLGHPELSAAGAPRHVSVLTGWLHNCDLEHDCMPSHGELFLPTRLLNVNFGATRCQLICNTDTLSQDSRYLALSHRWGTHPDPSLADKIVCTYESNIQYLASGFRDAVLPPLYQDAITIARKLGVTYLWIDSLCIVQAEPGNPEDKDGGQDFLREAGKMELVFSSAYATIAATCARSPAEHFLKCRPKRQFAYIPTERGPYHLAEVIDNFSEDVDRSELNSRGWVFQERALSRRTIYFAKNQSYWECGKGIRCETLTRTENIKSALLGDANFPFSLPDFDKGRRIKLFQALYERYTKLDFTYPTDRPIAIRGLETRLLRALDTRGGYGIFEQYMRRGLLWQREGSNLPRIDFFQSCGSNAHESVPSWSWMAYDGSIRYMEIPAAAEWKAWHADVRSPWEQDEFAKPTVLRVLVRNIVDFAAGARVILDEPENIFKHDFKCVVVGSKRAPDPMQADEYYAIIVTPLQGDDHICERAGVAFLEGRHIDWKSPAVAMHVR